MEKIGDTSYLSFGLSPLLLFTIGMESYCTQVKILNYIGREGKIFMRKEKRRRDLNLVTSNNVDVPSQGPGTYNNSNNSSVSQATIRTVVAKHSINRFSYKCVSRVMDTRNSFLRYTIFSIMHLHLNMKK